MFTGCELHAPLLFLFLQRQVLIHELLLQFSHQHISSQTPSVGSDLKIISESLVELKTT